MKRDEESAAKRKGRKSTLILNRFRPKKQPLPGVDPDSCQEDPGRRPSEEERERGEDSREIQGAAFGVGGEGFGDWGERE